MKEYQGITKYDMPINGGKNPRLTKQANEAWNYQSRGGFYYGHVETSKKNLDRRINIDLIGAGPKDDYVDGVTIVWIATPKTRGREVVGWWKNATVWRERQSRDNFKSDDQYGKSYIARANADDCVLLNVIERDLSPFKFPEHERKGWPGQTPWFFPEISENKSFQAYFEELKSAIQSDKFRRRGKHKTRSSSKTQSRFGKSSLLHRQQVEKFALDKTRLSIEEKYNGIFDFKDVSLENRGWDIEFILDSGGNKLNVEVKGLTGSEPEILLTPNEYKALISKDPNYRLAIVTRCLTTKYSVHIAYFDSKSWRIECIGGLKRSSRSNFRIVEIVSAKVKFE